MKDKLKLSTRLIEFKERCHLNDAEVALIAGCAPQSVRNVVLSGLDPHLWRVKANLEKALDLNAAARCRSDLKFL